MNDDRRFVIERTALIKRGEGSVNHMYLDSVGKVTVGVGNMLPTPEAAIELPFRHRDTGETATDDEIRAEYILLENQPPNRPAGSYERLTTLVLSDDVIDELLNARIVNFEIGLRQDFPGYDSYPDAARLGLLDMAFNLGNRGLVEKFPSFSGAARERNWRECVAECERVGISDDRNNEVKELFRSLEAGGHDAGS